MTRYHFGSFVVDDETIEIIGPDGVRDVEPQVFRVLHYLVGQRGRLVTKEELLDNVWGDRFVSESALTTRIKQARRAVDDDGNTQWAIKTIHGRGYRFVPDVEQVEGIEQTDETDGAASPVPSTLPEELQVETRQLFCGRADELEHCNAILQQSTADNTFGWVWILGEPGIGKTRLAAEVARSARDLGHRVIFGRNGEDLRVPYQPFIEVLRQVQESPDASTGPPLPPGLAPLLPASSGSHGPQAESAIDNDTMRYIMFEAVAEWLIDLSTISPVTMVVDDVHWAADSTVQLLDHLQRRQSDGAITFVLTSRDTAPDINPRVADLIAAGNGRPDTAVLRLDGLDTEDAVKLIGSDGDLDEIMRQTAGNPLFLQAVNHADGTVDMQSAVRRRLASLGEHVQETLRIGSILGLEFELRLAAETTERSEIDVLDDLEFAVAARLLDDVGHDRFRFSHALVRSSLRSELSSSRQARMHRRASIAIHEIHGDEPRYLPELAYHTAKAATVDNKLRPVAIERLRQAAHASSAKFSFDEAGQLLELARSIADQSDHDQLARLALEQGIAESRGGQNRTAAHTFDSALVSADRTDDIRLRVEAAIRYEDASWRPGLSGHLALERLNAATQLLDDADDSHPIEDETELRGRLAVATLRALAMSGQQDGVEEAFSEALALAETLGSPNLEANALSVYIGQVMLFDGVHGMTGFVQRLAELEPFIDDGDVALHAFHDRILHATLLGRFEDRPAPLKAMIALQERSHSRFWEFIRANQEAMEAHYRGDLELSEHLAQHCLELANALPEEDGSGTFGLRMFLIRREQDRLAGMAPLVEQVLADADADGIWTPGLALLLIETGATDEAAAALAPLRANGFSIPVDAMWSTVMVLLIEAVVQLGDVEACRVLRSRFKNQEGVNITTGSGLLCFGRAERYLGMMSLVIGELDVAEEQLGVALEGDDAGGSVLWRNESRLWLSRVRRAQGHVDEADAMLDVVATEAGAAGLRRLQRLASERTS